MNNLSNEKSLYLKTHANDPINWYSWNEDAFKKASEKNKLIFLSIGYSTCHWCHVMQKESFKDEDVAKVVNESFIAIKVDREERPDIDMVYMQVATSFIGHGGWPLSVIITPNQEPVFIATYLPKERFIDILNKVQNEWINNQNYLIHNSKEVIKAISNSFHNRSTLELKDYEDIIYEAYEILLDNFDPINGGFFDSPKFPTPHNLLFLLNYYYAYDKKEALEMGVKTLYQMYKGGIFDHLNNGFYRYSVDAKWLIPHFEKMLYDNALLAITYLLYYEETKDEVLKNVSIKILDFVQEYLLNQDGSFCSSIDADSEGVEGKFYLWNYYDIINSLTSDEANLIISYFNITKEGNFEGKNIFNLLHQSDSKLREIPHEIITVIEKLKSIQKKRTHPAIDKKVLTSWNSMMIWTYTLASDILNNPKYLQIAKTATKFILEYMFNEDNELYTSYIDGEKNHLGNLDDYAYLINALIELFLLTNEEFYLDKAIQITNTMITQFRDFDGSFFFSTKNDLIVKPKDHYDGAIPSAQSMVLYDLIRLNQIHYDPKYLVLIKQNFKLLNSIASKSPTTVIFSLLSYIIYNNNKNHIVIIYSEENDLNYFKNIIKKSVFSTIIYLNKNTISDSKYFEEYFIEEDFGLFVCKNGVCEEPIYDIYEAQEFLKDFLG